MLFDVQHHEKQVHARAVRGSVQSSCCQLTCMGEKMYLTNEQNVPATKNREAGISPRFGGWHHFPVDLIDHRVLWYAVHIDIPRLIEVIDELLA
jgi:hypothetical protein